MRRIRIAILAALASACSTLGTPASPPGPLPHGGTGQFRALTAAETTITGPPLGVTLNTSGHGVDVAMSIEGNCFYAAGAIRPTPPNDAAILPDAGPTDGAVANDAAVSSDAALDASLDAGPSTPPTVNWANFEARQIFRSTPGASWAFGAGTMVLAASASWEGGYVTDPWVVHRADGRYLLYYAAAGGIGVASAASLDGPWMREGAGPILPASGGATPRRPSAIVTTGLSGASSAMLLYYELGGTIHLASSDDGIALHDLGAVTTTPIAARDDRDGVESSVGSPGAIVVPTPAGRRVVRVYFESRRTNGTVLIGMLGSADGVTFEQLATPVFAERDRQAPAPRLVDERTTILYTWVANMTFGAEIASVSPAGVTLTGVTPPNL
jgi:hypothetical protein